jgi:formylglycine-generating enzyme required for sulfatase activity
MSLVRPLVLGALLGIVLGGCTGAPAAVDDGMARIPAGAFRMGTDSAEVPALLQRYGTRRAALFEAEHPARTVRVAAFRLDRTEVTNERYAAFLAAEPSWRPGRIPDSLHDGDYLRHWTGGRPADSIARHPVVFVSWQAAAAYCAWAGRRLPTEAEWEYAARGGLTGEVFPWGERMPHDSLVNWGGDRHEGPVAVGSYAPNGYGLHDMAGNVWEFVQDEWRTPAGVEPPAPHASDGRTRVSTRRVIRGGSWGAAAVNLRVRWRDSHPPDDAGDHVGFRCAAGDR